MRRRCPLTTRDISTIPRLKRASMVRSVFLQWSERRVSVADFSLTRRWAPMVSLSGVCAGLIVCE